MVTGLAAIGSMVLGGSMAAATTVSLATVAVGAVTSAVVGAAIGGLTAAVMGGDIGKGMLFGAVGGVVTGGLAGGVLADAGLVAGEGALGMSQGQLAIASAQGSYAGDLAMGATTALGQGASAAASGSSILGSAGGSLFGGTLASEGLKQALPLVFDFAKGAMSEEEHVDWRTTEEGVRAALESAERQTAIANAGSKHAPMPWQNTKEGAMYTLEEQKKQIQLQTQGKLQEVDKTYELANVNAQKEFERGRSVYDKAAKAAKSGEYKSGLEAKQQGMLSGTQEATV